MSDKLATRSARAYTFTFDEDGDKVRYSILAKAHGRTLAGMIKYLLLAAGVAAKGPG